MKFLSSFNWTRIGLALFGVLALVAVIVMGVRGCKQIEADQDNQLVNAGVTQERSANQGKVISDVQNAQDATRAPTPAERQRVCDKYDRNCAPSNQ